MVVGRAFLGKETRHREITSKVEGKVDEKGKSKQDVIKWVETFNNPKKIFFSG